MSKPNIERTFLDGVFVITPMVYEDDRGYFYEILREATLSDLGMQIKFVQENQSKSSKGVLRGLHFQKEFPQGKLIRVISGRIYDVAVDLREDSKTYMSCFGVELTSDNRKQLYIAPGFAHGFVVLSDTAEVVYKCTEYYHPEDEGGIIWNDKSLNVDWPIILSEDSGIYMLKDGTPITLSEKDKRWSPLCVNVIA